MEEYLLRLVLAGEYGKGLPTDVQNVNSCSSELLNRACCAQLTLLLSTQWTI